MKIATFVSSLAAGFLYDYFDVIGVALLGLCLLAIQMLALFYLFVKQPINEPALSHEESGEEAD
jgi:predicted MFS family arabinose efflux permease